MAIHSALEHGYGVLTLDRPERAHAYDREHLDLIESSFNSLASQVPVVIIESTGQGAFCGGADLKALAKAAPEEALDLRSQQVFTAIARSAAVSIAVVHGPAVAGGCELSLACDLRVVGPRARFKLPETALGIIPAAGGCTRLTRLLGASMAKQIILAGRELSADDAVLHGLALAQAEEPGRRARALARALLERDAVALRLAKQIIDRSEERSSLEAERVAEAFLYARRQDS